MDLGFIVDMYVPMIVVACLIVGYIFKKWIKDVDNKWIPTIVTILGLVLGGCVNGWTFVHQLFTQIIEGGENK